MGTNKRYADAIDRRRDAQTRDIVASDGEPDSLTDEELELDTHDLTRTRRPQHVMAWVRYGKTGMKVDARVVAWTTKAVAIEWTTKTGAVHHAWVWASAVERS
ncbi:MAG: hypothetical protein KF761_10450 [Salinibacterium sp.]|nr:hypothetical protein [Salinibacterium sp.]